MGLVVFSFSEDCFLQIQPIIGPRELSCFDINTHHTGWSGSYGALVTLQ